MPTDRKRPGAIDYHAHLGIPEVLAVTLAHSLTSLPVDLAAPQSDEVRQHVTTRRKRMEHLQNDFVERIGLMDEMGVAIQVLTCSLVHQATFMLPLEESVRLERIKNDKMSAIVAGNPKRYIGLGSVPLQDPNAAVAELERCMGPLGLRGVQISTFYAGRELGHIDNHPFWAKAEELDAAIYIHPAGNRDDRFRLHSQWNSIGQSFEEAMAIASLMYEGVMEKYPALNICISHGGGYMPFNYARISRNFVEKPATRVNMSRPPADFLKLLTYDSCLYDQHLIEQLVDIVGEDRVVLGSDYPVGDRKPVEFIEGCNLSDAVKDKVLWKNAARILGVDMGTLGP